MNWINNISQQAEEFFKHALTVDKAEAVQNFIISHISNTVQHKINLYGSYLGLTKTDLIHAINSAFPSLYNDTIGKTLETILNNLK